MHHRSPSPAPRRAQRSLRSVAVRALSAILLVGGIGLATAAPAAAEGEGDGPPPPSIPTPPQPQRPTHVWVCKYVGPPADEVLKPGKNPISVSISSVPNTVDPVQVGSEWTDAQHGSHVVQIGGEDPGISACAGQQQQDPDPVLDLNLTFSQECPQPGDPSSWRASWFVTNPNAFEVAFTVDRHGGTANPVATGTAAAATTTYFTTPWGAQTLILKWQDENGATTSTTKAGGDTTVSIDTDKCRPGQPADEVEVVTVDGTIECDATTVSTTTTTTTTSYVWTGTEWALDTEGAEVVVTEGERELTADEREACPIIQEPTLGITALTPVCQADVPYIEYDATVDGVEFTTATLTFRDRNDVVVETRTVDSLRGRTLFPGAEVDADGNGVDWPGWRFENGFWVEDPSDAILREGLTVTIEVNPSATAQVAYPPATSACASPENPEVEALVPVAPGPMTPPATQSPAPAPNAPNAPEVPVAQAPPAPTVTPVQAPLPSTGSTSGLLAAIAAALVLGGLGLRRFGPGRSVG